MSRSLIAVVAGVVLSIGCASAPPQDVDEEASIVNQPSLSDVLARHAPDLMALDGVILVYEGQLEDGRPCLVVGVRSLEAVAGSSLPSELEGYPVEVRVSGNIRPMEGN